MEEYTIVIQGNLREGSTILVNGVSKRVVSYEEYDSLRWKKWELDKVHPQGGLYRVNSVWSTWKNLEECKERARKEWSMCVWPECRKHLMIKQGGHIVFEHEQK